MNRPLGKKFEPRPKRIQRSVGSYWVANPCVSEHFLIKQIGYIDRQKAMFSSAQSRQQRQLHQDLNNIKATKNCRRRVVVVMDQKGKQLKEYEHGNHNKRLITYPILFTSTSNRNICVVDWLDNEGRGRVVVLSPGGDILGVYTDPPDVNTGKKPFTPRGILTTPSDNIILTDMNNH
ncbi:Hypothetical predicted protein [Mytilus galloprovincialis]|uniref:Uncharacterized protein n=1 Tax=Mytilus galloprovincialis TaxID=29158 RepID=A0A8B6HI83_MYTGA|nr:Hypothetical predicted protein [Mytilus galloprovincialis]